MANRPSVVVGILLLIIVVLGVFVVYAFAVRPAITGYTVDKQTEGYQYGVTETVVAIMQQAASRPCQVVPLTFANQTVNVIDINCLDLPQQQLQG